MEPLREADVEAKLIEEISAILSKEPASIQADVPLHNLGIDSMSFVELLVFIEKAFHLRLIDSGLAREDFETIRSLARCICRKSVQS